jgi:hypothetical protein
MAAMMMAALIGPAWCMSASARKDLYHVLLTGRTLGLKAARMLLSRLRDDLTRFDLPARTELIQLAAEHAWTNINAYLDMCMLLPAADLHTRVPITQLIIEPDYAEYARDALDILLHELDVSGASWQSGRLTERSANLLYALIGLADLAGRLELYEPRISNLPPLNRLRALALWVRAEQRGLYAEMPGEIPTEESQFILTVAPDLAERARRLAAQQGLRDPFL